MRQWLVLALLVAVAIGLWLAWGDGTNARIWVALLLGVWTIGGVVAYVAFRRHLFGHLNTQDYIIAAMFIGLLYAVILPWRLGLGRIPVIHAFVFAIPFTVVFIIAVRLVPKPGGATLILAGRGILYQLLGTGINPLWWPDFLLQSVAVESYLLFTGDHARTRRSAIVLGVLRGLMAHLYFYFVGAPFIWRTFYEGWFVLWQIFLGSAGCAVGGWLGHRLANRVETAFHYGGV